MKKKSRVDLSDPAVVWTSYDLGVAAALLCLGYELLSLDRSTARKVLFVFRRVGDIDDVANSYFADKLELNARAFFDQLKALKSRLYSE
jgi:hypothetical protein